MILTPILSSDPTKANKVAGAVAGDLAGLSSSGDLTDSGVKPSDFVTSSALAAKADKVAGATAGNVATLNSSGNLVDGGVTMASKANASTVATIQGQVTALQNGKADLSGATFTGDIITAGISAASLNIGGSSFNVDGSGNLNATSISSANGVSANSFNGGTFNGSVVLSEFGTEFDGVNGQLAVDSTGHFVAFLNGSWNQVIQGLPQPLSTTDSPTFAGINCPTTAFSGLWVDKGDYWNWTPDGGDYNGVQIVKDGLQFGAGGFTSNGNFTVDTGGNISANGLALGSGAITAGQIQVAAVNAESVNTGGLLANSYIRSTYVGGAAFVSDQGSVPTNNAFEVQAGGITLSRLGGSGEAEFTGLTVHADFTNGVNGSQLLLTGATNPDYQMSLGVDTTNQVGVISVLQADVGYWDLHLCPVGGNVVAGGSITAAAFNGTHNGIVVLGEFGTEFDGVNGQLSVDSGGNFVAFINGSWRNVTLGLPQALGTTDSPTFAGINVDSIGQIGLNGGGYVSIGTSLFFNGHDVGMNNGTGSGGGTLNMDGGIIEGIAGGGQWDNDGINLSGAPLNMNAGSGSGGGTLNMDGGSITNAGSIIGVPSAGLVIDGNGDTHPVIFQNANSVDLSGIQLNMNVGDNTGGGTLNMDGGNIVNANQIVLNNTDGSTAAPLALYVNAGNLCWKDNGGNEHVIVGI